MDSLGRYAPGTSPLSSSSLGISAPSPVSRPGRASTPAHRYWGKEIVEMGFSLYFPKAVPNEDVCSMGPAIVITRVDMALPPGSSEGLSLCWAYAGLLDCPHLLM